MNVWSVGTISAQKKMCHVFIITHHVFYLFGNFYFLPAV